MQTHNTSAKPRPLVALALLMALALLFTNTTFAQHGHDHDHDDIEFPEPTNFVEAAAQTLEIVSHLRVDLENGDFDHIHDDSIILARVASMLGRFALSADSGVARPHVREINIAGRELALIADRLHDAADVKNEAACRQHLDAMREHLAVIEMNLKRVTDRTYTAIITSAEPPIQAGREVTLQIEIKDDRDQHITSFDVVHEKRLHLIAVSDDLGWFTHHHPTLNDNGRFDLTMQFPAGGTYRLFHGFKPTGMPTAIAKADVTVEGERRERMMLKPNVDQPQQVGEYEVEPHGIGPIHAGRETALWFIVKRNGDPIENLQPHFGERGHLVVISRDLEHFIHAHAAGHRHDDDHHIDHHHGHADDHGHQHQNHGHDDHDHDHHAGALGFHVKLPEPGLYRMWVQFKHDDEVHVAAFTVNVEPKPAHDAHDSHGHSHGEGHDHRH
jgi:hypothetical protein